MAACWVSSVECACRLLAMAVDAQRAVQQGAGIPPALRDG
jgi:hypothetical protein